MYLIHVSHEEILQGLESWSWLPVEGKTPIAVTAFGDVFMESAEGIWFLDTLEGSLERVADNRTDLEILLNTVEGQDHFLMSGFVDRAISEGMRLEEGECYDFRINPVLGGAIEYENIEVQNFVVSLNVAGQIHEQVKDLPPGTKINNIQIDM